MQTGHERKKFFSWNDTKAPLNFCQIKGVVTLESMLKGCMIMSLVCGGSNLVKFRGRTKKFRTWVQSPNEKSGKLKFSSITMLTFKWAQYLKIFRTEPEEKPVWTLEINHSFFNFIYYLICGAINCTLKMTKLINWSQKLDWTCCCVYVELATFDKKLVRLIQLTVQLDTFFLWIWRASVASARKSEKIAPITDMCNLQKCPIEQYMVPFMIYSTSPVKVMHPHHFLSEYKSRPVRG